MPRGVKKENLPSKICLVCERPFTWRKKWERVWDEVTTCSKSCNRKRKEGNRRGSKESDSDRTECGSNVVNGSEDEGVFSQLNTENTRGDFVISEASISPEDAQQMVPGVANDGISACSEEASDDFNFVSDFDLEVANGRDLPILDAKAQRKADKKSKKAERRAQREGKGDPTAGQKQCTICDTSVDLLIRCTYDKSGEWGMVCGKCWGDVSGGVVDGDANHPHYRYGGLWKNRRAQK